MFGAIPIPPPSCSFCGPCLWPYGVALSPAPWLAAFTACCQLAAVLVPLWPCRWLAPSRWRGLGGWWCGSLHAGRGFRGWRAPLPKSLSESPGKSQKSLAKSLKKSLRSVPKSLVLSQNHSRLQNSVYKGGIFLAHFPGVDGKSCKSRSFSAYFDSKSLASMYLRWSCSGVKPSICGWFGVKTISCLSTMP